MTTTSLNELVLIPGLNNTHAVFDSVVKALPASVQALAVDNPAIDTVEGIAQALLPTLPERFWLAGFSFGGYVALAMLEAAPQRVQGIALLCTSPFADGPEAIARRRTSLEKVEQGGYFNLIQSQAALAFHPDSLSNAALMAEREEMVRAYGAQRYLAHVRATIARPDRSVLLDGRRPTLVLAASHDKAFSVDTLWRYADRIPGVQKALINDAGHMAPMEKPIQVATALARWMQTPA